MKALTCDYRMSNSTFKMHNPRNNLRARATKPISLAFEEIKTIEIQFGNFSDETTRKNTQQHHTSGVCVCVQVARKFVGLHVNGCRLRLRIWAHLHGGFFFALFVENAERLVVHRKQTTPNRARWRRNRAYKTIHITYSTLEKKDWERDRDGERKKTHSHRIQIKTKMYKCDI